MNTKITLTTPDPVAVSEPGKPVTTLSVTHFEVRQLSVSLNAGQVFGAQAVLAPLAADGQPVRHAQPVRKNWTGGEAGPLKLEADLEKILAKLWP